MGKRLPITIFSRTNLCNFSKFRGAIKVDVLMLGAWNCIVSNIGFDAFSTYGTQKRI